MGQCLKTFNSNFFIEHNTKWQGICNFVLAVTKITSILNCHETDDSVKQTEPITEFDEQHNPINKTTFGSYSNAFAINGGALIYTNHCNRAQIATITKKLSANDSAD